MRRAKDEKEGMRIANRNYLWTGIFMIFIGISYFFASDYMYYFKTVNTYQGYIVYLVALLAFISIGSSIYGVIKYKWTHNPILAGIKSTNLANALTAIVLTQIVLLDNFGMDKDYSHINGAAGMSVGLVIVIMGVKIIFNFMKRR